MSTYVFSDLHAQYNLWKQIKNFIKPEDIVFCLGDCVDRGPDNLNILYEVMNTPNITLLRGNHEDFISYIGSKLVAANDEDVYDLREYLDLWYMNGAKNTVEAFEKLSLSEKKDLIAKIKALPTHVEYTNKFGDVIYLCHAGRNPQTKEIEDTRTEFSKLFSTSVPTDNFIWDRSHIGELEWKGLDNEYCVHGHTPVMYMKETIRFMDFEPAVDDEICRYCGGHKINIDLGSFITHRACLLNLDTFEPIYFEEN